jgi:hypothetical protein
MPKTASHSQRSLSMKMPNFFVIGATKSGTTSVYEWLKQHPQIYMSPRKEPNFFASEGGEFVVKPGVRKSKYPVIKDIEDYRALFQDVSNESAIGEATVGYLFNPRTPERLRLYVPDARLIAILRDPVDRAISHYRMMVRGGDEPIADFVQALDEEEHRIRSNWDAFSWSYKGVGLYYVQLKRYFDLFERSQIRVYLYEDLKSDPISLIQDIFRFLQVDYRFTPDLGSKHNQGYVPRNEVARILLTKPNPFRYAYRSLMIPFIPKEKLEPIIRWLMKRRVELSLEARKKLIEVFRDDILMLQELIQRDLSDWLK